MIRTVVPGAWVWRLNWPQIDTDNAHGGVDPWDIFPWLPTRRAPAGGCRLIEALSGGLIYRFRKTRQHSRQNQRFSPLVSGPR